MKNHPLIGNPNGVVDLQARVTNKKLREICAEAIVERDKAHGHIRQLGEALLACSELLAEARGCLAEASGADSYADIIARIDTALGG